MYKNYVKMSFDDTVLDVMYLRFHRAISVTLTFCIRPWRTEAFGDWGGFLHVGDRVGTVNHGHLVITVLGVTTGNCKRTEEKK